MPRAVTTELRLGAVNGRWAGGKTKHPLYEIYLDMVGRCGRATHQRFASYGGRGIQVCARWRKDFWNFVADMGPRPDGKGHSGRAIYSLDRVDNDGHYEQSNCRWATNIEQANNKRGYGDFESHRDPVSGQFTSEGMAA